MPRFSLVVPTLHRADTLERTLETLVAQPERDLEIVVQNNGNDPMTREVIASADDPRIRHFHTDEVRPMVENWELAVANCTGEFVMFLGDDDGAMPDACSIAARVFDRNDVEILWWEPFLYLWPGFHDTRRANQLHASVNLSFTLQSVLAAPELERFFGFATHYSKLPMIYHSFIARSLIQRVREKHGRYFFGSLPDVTSGIVNAASVKRFLRSTRPLSVAGLSHNSGGQHVTRAGTEAPREELARDFPRLHALDEISASGNLELMIGTDMAIVREEFLDDRVEYDERRLVHAMARAINDAPDRYERTLAAIRVLVDRLGMAPDEVVVPERVSESTPLGFGAHARGPYESLFVIDCEKLGLNSVADAVRLASQIVPGIDQLDPSMIEVLEADAPRLSREPLGLGKGGDGRPALQLGWAEPEDWGSWSIEREASLRLKLPTTLQSPLRLAVRYRSVPLPGGRERSIECFSAGRSIASWKLSEHNFQGELEVQVGWGANAEFVELMFVNHDLQSPFELGIGADTRRLGLGVEQIRLLPETEA